MFTYQTGISCCNGIKVTIYKITDGRKEAIETYADFLDEKLVQEFAKTRIEELNKIYE